MDKIKQFWRDMQLHAHKHEKAVHRTHHALHLSYFTMVATHGPYHWAAALLLIIGLLAWVLHLEIE